MRLSESTEETSAKKDEGEKIQVLRNGALRTLRVLGKSGETSERDQERKKGLEK